MHRKMDFKADSRELDEYRNNKLEHVTNFKTAIATAPVIPENPSEIDTKNEKMRLEFADLLNKKCGREQDGTPYKSPSKTKTTDYESVDKIYSALAEMLYQAFMDRYEKGGDHYFVDPRPSTANPRDEKWLPKQRMALLLGGLFQAKSLAGKIWSGYDAVLELVAAPASNLDQLCISAVSNGTRGRKVEHTKREAKKVLERVEKLKRGELIDGDAEDHFAGKVKRRQPQPRRERESVRILKANNLFEDDDMEENILKTPARKTRQRKTRTVSNGNDPAGDLSSGSSSNSIMDAPAEGKSGAKADRRKRAAPSKSDEGASRSMVSKRRKT